MNRRNVLSAAAVAAAALGLPGMAQASTTVPKWAVLNASGTIVRMAGATGSSHLSTGTYQVVFKSDVSQCAYVATVGDPGAGAVSQPGIATVATRAGNNSALFIQTFDQSSGALADLPFQVVTYCGSNAKFAVVASDGTKARGKHAPSTTHLGPGSYEVLFDSNVSQCAFNASIGTTGAGSIPSPGQVTVAGRAGNLKGVFVRIVDRLGNEIDSSFHLGVSCGATNLAAVVESSGSLARGTDVVSVAKLSGANGGTYEVIFDTTVAGCGYAATVGTSTNGGSISTPVTITTATRAGNPNGVFLFIHQTNGSTIDEPFHLYVFCPGATNAPTAAPARPGVPQPGAVSKPGPTMPSQQTTLNG